MNMLSPGLKDRFCPSTLGLHRSGKNHKYLITTVLQMAFSRTLARCGGHVKHGHGFDALWRQLLVTHRVARNVTLLPLIRMNYCKATSGSVRNGVTMGR